MSNQEKGQKLEDFVSAMENLALPDGCTIEPRKKIYHDDGFQLAEFDVAVRGTLGTTEFNWLIECRNRPSQGPSPGGWINELIGKRSNNEFDKVIAVSTTGFSEPAKVYAEKGGVELRTLFDAKELQSRLNFFIEKRNFDILKIHVKGLIGVKKGQDPKPLGDAFKKATSNLNPGTAILRSIEDQSIVRTKDAFSILIDNSMELQQYLDSLSNDTEFTITSDFTRGEEPYCVVTEEGAVPVTRINYVVQLVSDEKLIAPSSIVTYDNQTTGNQIAESAVFPIEFDNKKWEVTIDRISSTGKSKVSVESK